MRPNSVKFKILNTPSMRKAGLIQILPSRTLSIFATQEQSLLKDGMTLNASMLVMM